MAPEKCQPIERQTILVNGSCKLSMSSSIVYEKEPGIVSSRESRLFSNGSWSRARKTALGTMALSRCDCTRRYKVVPGDELPRAMAQRYVSLGTDSRFLLFSPFLSFLFLIPPPSLQLSFSYSCIVREKRRAWWTCTDRRTRGEETGRYMRVLHARYGCTCASRWSENACNRSLARWIF